MAGTLNNGWSFHTVKELSSFVRRGKSPTYSENDEGVWVINQECVTWDGIDFSKVKFQNDSVEIPTDFYLQVGDILLNSTGIGTIGRVTIFRGGPKPCFADSHVTILRVKREVIREDFLRYYLSSEQGQRHLQAFCYSGSTKQIELSRKFLLKTVVTSPRIEEQDAILACFNSVDAVINAARGSIVKAKRLQKGLMQQLLTGRLKPDGTPRSSHEFGEHPKLGFVPKTWICEKGRKIFRLHSGYSPEALAFTAAGNDGDCLFMKVDDFNHPSNRIAIKATAQSLALGDRMAVFDVCKPNWLVIAKRGAAITHNRVRILTRPTLLDPNLIDAKRAFACVLPLSADAFEPLAIFGGVVGSTTEQQRPLPALVRPPQDRRTARDSDRFGKRGAVT